MVQFCTKSAILFTIVVVALAMTGCCNAFTPGKPLPAKFLGSWTVDHSDNFDEYLEAKGLSLIYNSEK
jgi:hypothetical protein